jgi:hypothetical protein
MRFKPFVLLFVFFLTAGKSYCLSEDHIDERAVAFGTCFPQAVYSANIDQDQFALTITPNPVEGVLQLSLKSNVSDEAQVLIYNSLGVLIKEVYITINHGTSQFEIPVSNIHPGLYFLKIKGKIVNTTGRFIKR